MPQDGFVNQIVGEDPDSLHKYEDDLTMVKNSLNRAEKSTKNKRLLILLGGLVFVGLVISGVVAYFSSQGKSIYSPISKNWNKQSAKEMVQSPLTGELFSADMPNDWISVRPLAVMINNHTDARPQSGLIYADLVYEIVAEGGITRFLSFFNTNVPEKIGPVRSTREYYLVLVKELGDAMLMHIGWSPQALEAIETWPVRSLGRGGGQFWRDNPRGVATEHTAYTNGKELIKTGLSLGWGGTRELKTWMFKDSSDVYQSFPNASKVAIDFWYPGDYSAVFQYDPSTNSYIRFMGYDAENNPIPHVDQETAEQIRVKNLIVQFVKEDSIAEDEKGRLDYELVGSGKGLVFIDGKVINVTWNKIERDSRTMFYDLNGKEIEFNRGKFWISIVPDRNIEQVVYN